MTLKLERERFAHGADERRSSMRCASPPRRAAPAIAATAAAQKRPLRRAGMRSAEAARRARAPHGGGGQLQQTGAPARTGVLRGRGGRVARTRHGAQIDRERLARLLGVPEGRAPVARHACQTLPAAPLVEGITEQVAMSVASTCGSRRRARSRMARSLGLTAHDAVHQRAGDRLREHAATGEPRADGWEIEVALPLFDFGDARWRAPRRATGRPFDRRRRRDRRSLRSARGLRRVPHRVRPRAALPRRDRAAAQAHRRRERCFATTAC